MIWSLKSDTAKLPDDYDRNVFWISTWLPQIELLSHRAVVAGLTHCGFGGTLEFIAAGIPLLTLAHFADQPMNAALMEDAGMAINLYRQTGDCQTNDKDITFYHEAPGFDANEFASKLKRLLHEPSFKANALRLKVASMAQGGRQAAVNVVERSYLHYQRG